MSKPRIMVVEDEGIVAKDLQSRLLALGYEPCGWATSGEEAVQSAGRLRPDLVLMDIHLKGELDGIEAAERIGRESGAPVVFITAYADRETLARAKGTGPLGYILKPFEERELRVAVELALHKHRIDGLLRDRERWLSTTLKSIGDGVVTVDEAGVVTSMNPVAESLTGWTAEEALTHPVGEVLVALSEESLEPVENPAERGLRGGAPPGPEARLVLRSREGKTTPFEPVASLIKDDAGTVFGAVLVLRDISERRRSEAELAALLRDLQRSNADLTDEKALLSALFEANPAPVFVVDARSRVLMANQAVTRRFGPAWATGDKLTPGSLLKCPAARERPEMCGQLDECRSCPVCQAIFRAISGEVVRQAKADMTTGEGEDQRELSLLVSAVPLDYREDRLSVVILEDVTELSALRKVLGGDRSFAGIVGSDRKMLEVYDVIREVADLNVPVLIQGESGTGKELVAAAIHSQGARAGRSFITVNCGALPDGLIESELFGHVKGAFTGAIRDKKGRFELANGGTLFLDEIGDISPVMQVKLLRGLQSGTFEPVGGERSVRVDVRVIAATHKDLAAEVRAGRFREDLFYRVCVVPIHIPALRERPNDIPLLTASILERATAVHGRPPARVSEAALDLLLDYGWPGNVRELQNVLQFALIKCKGQTIEPKHFPRSLLSPRRAGAQEPPRRKGLSEAAVEEALRSAEGDKVAAAKLLGVSRATLYRHLPRRQAEP